MNTKRPIIKPDYVQQALDSLVYTSTPERPNPLWGLTAVDEIVSSPDFPPTSHARMLVLLQLILSFISDGLAMRRLAHGLSAPNPTVSVHEAGVTIERDAQFGAELTGWSLLYHRYVCPHLNLSQEILKTAIHADARTVRRYQSFALAQLTLRLSEREGEARARLHRRRLYSQLPSMNSVRLFGRERQIKYVFEQFANDNWRQVVVTGAAGIGKTVFVQECVRGLIDAEHVMQVVWIDHPASTARIVQTLYEQLIPDGIQVDLRNYILTYPVAIVLDGINPNAFEGDTLTKLLRDLSPAFVFVVFGTFVALETTYIHVGLSELDAEATTALVSSLIERDNRLLSSDAARLGSLVWERVGGHPLAITLFVQNLEFLQSTPFIGTDLLDRVYGSRYQMLPEGAKRGLWMLALMPPDAASLDTLAALWATQKPHSYFNELVNTHFIDLAAPDAATLIMPESVRQFMKARASAEHGASALVNSLLIELDAQLMRENPDAESVTAYILETDFLPLPDALRRRWVHILCLKGFPESRASEWRALLEETLDASASPLNLDLKTAYGVCLRRLGDWTGAHRVLHDAAIHAGRLGVFAHQSKIMIELSVLARYRGDYTRALTLLNQAESTALRFGERDLLVAVLTERAQVAVDQKNGSAAYHALRELPDSVRVLALRAEADLLLGDTSAGKAWIEQALMSPDSLDPAMVGRLYTILGRLSEREQKWMAAQYHFFMAWQRFEQAGDVFALGRIQANLGAIAIHLTAYDDAHALLVEAKKSQNILGDQVALAITRHNLASLMIRRSITSPDS